jgi:hypothetical protein
VTLRKVSKHSFDRKEQDQKCSFWKRSEVVLNLRENLKMPLLGGHFSCENGAVRSAIFRVHELPTSTQHFQIKKYQEMGWGQNGNTVAFLVSAPTRQGFAKGRIYAMLSHLTEGPGEEVLWAASSNAKFWWPVAPYPKGSRVHLASVRLLQTFQGKLWAESWHTPGGEEAAHLVCQSSLDGKAWTFENVAWEGQGNTACEGLAGPENVASTVPETLPEVPLFQVKAKDLWNFSHSKATQKSAP